MASSISLKNLFWTFFKIGSTTWGNYVSFIAVIQSYVKNNDLLEDQEVVDIVFLGSVLPGPVILNVVAGIGYRLRGLKGALVCALGVLLPTFVLICGLSVAYFQWGRIPVVDKLFMGLPSAIVAIVICCVWSMSRKTIRGLPEIIISLLACAVIVGIGNFYSTIGIILGSGLIGWWLFREKALPPKPSEPALEAKKYFQLKDSSRLFSVSALPAMWLLTVQPSLILKLFTTFAAVSVTVFGNGYVLIPIIQKIVVNNLEWVTNKEFIDSLVISQITPGPLAYASFIGYKVAGLLGAIAATTGMFLPPALLMLIGMYFLDNIKHSSGVRAALRGVRAAVIGMLLATAFILARTAPLHWASVVIFVVALIALIRFRVEVALVMPVAGIASLVLY